MDLDSGCIDHFVYDDSLLTGAVTLQMPMRVELGDEQI